jgi:hypothetical protein
MSPVRQSRYKNAPPFVALIDVTLGWGSSLYISTNWTKKSPAHVSGGVVFAADAQQTAKHHGRAEGASRGGWDPPNPTSRVGLGSKLIACDDSAGFARFGFLALA